MTVPALDFWFEFASTYSYPAAMRIGALARKAGVEVRFRPFLLGPIFKAQGWDTSPFNLLPGQGPQYVARHRTDLRRAEAPVPAAGAVSAGEPAGGARRAGWARRRSGRRSGRWRFWGRDFCLAVYRAEFADGLRIDEPATIRAILSDLKVDPDKAIATAQTRRHQGQAPIANSRSPTTGNFWRANFHDAGRRTVLGKRPA